MYRTKTGTLARGCSWQQREPKSTDFQARGCHPSCEYWCWGSQHCSRSCTISKCRERVGFIVIYQYSNTSVNSKPEFFSPNWQRFSSEHWSDCHTVRQCHCKYCFLREFAASEGHTVETTALWLGAWAYLKSRWSWKPCNGSETCSHSWSTSFRSHSIRAIGDDIECDMLMVAHMVNFLDAGLSRS